MATTLIESAKNGQLDVIRQLVMDGYDVTQRCSPDGATALYWSACNGHLATCDWLIRHGADVNQSVEKSGSIPLHGAADRGHADCALLLIRKGSCIDKKTRSNGDTPLHLAAYRGHVDVCRVLLQNGACADVVNAQGCTALDDAQIQNHYDIFQLLCKHRQRKRFSCNQRKSETCLLNPMVGRQSNKLITEVLSRSSEWDKTDTIRDNSYEFLSTNRLHAEENSTSEAKDDKNHSIKLEETFRSSEIRPDISVVQNESKTNDLNSISSQKSDPPNSLSAKVSSKTDDVIQELVTKFNQLVTYSSDLQLQLTIREDEKEKLSKENEILIERLECCKKIAKAVEESNRARVESERRALRAERELVGLQQRIEALLSLNLINEQKLLLAENNKTYSYSHNSAFESNHELQPRGSDSS